MALDRKSNTPSDGADSPSTHTDEKVPVVGELNIEGSTSPEPDADPQAVSRLLRKLDSRVLPIFLVLWFLTFIDRVNIANAKVQGLEKGLGMVGNQYNVALTVRRSSHIPSPRIC